jgi:hypothetical protein
VNKTSELLDRRRDWVLLAPVANVVLTKKSGLLFRVDQVHLVSKRSLPYRWKQLGLPAKVSDLRDGQGRFLDHFFSGVETFAVARRSGVGREVRDELRNIVREELSILAATQLGFAKRHAIAVPEMYRKKRYPSESYLLLDSEDLAWTQRDRTLGSAKRLLLDHDWLRFQSEVAFDALLAALQGRLAIKRTWRRDLRNAVVLVGQSQCTMDLPQAFLWNMIALELLLTGRGDKLDEALPKRAEAFLGWASPWHDEGYTDRIQAVYKKRCELVHQGRRDVVALRDVYFTDDLIFNLLANISSHFDLFSSKDAVIDFSKRLEAERVLGIDAKVRPRTLTFMRRLYRERDFDRQ